MSSAIFADGLLDGRTVLVTGGGTGLGLASARELLACGASVVICGRREDVLAEAAAMLGERCSYVVGDVRDGEDATRIVDACLERHGALHALVNNAGGQYFVPAEAIALKGWQAVTRLNVGGRSPWPTSPTSARSDRRATGWSSTSRCRRITAWPA